MTVYPNPAIRTGLFVAVALLASLPRLAAAAPAEVRGTWVTTTGLEQSTSAVYTSAKTATSFRQLRETGLNSVYMDVWRNGYTYYNSPTLKSTIGASALPSLGGRDLLQETLIQSHRNGMAQIGWFQYGFAAKFGNPGSSSAELAKVMADRGWLLKDSSGAYTNASNKFAWMNPLVPGVRDFVKGIVLDAVRSYDLDGIQFDDRLAWPVEFGYDDYTRTTYKAETGRDLPADPKDAAFKRWRADKLTAFAQDLQTAVKAVNPNCLVTVAPSTYPFSYDSYCVDWPAWRQAGLFDEIVPQVYRRTYDGTNGFDAGWDGSGSGGQVQFFGNRRGDFAAGISINGSDFTLSASDLTRSIQLVRNTAGVAGHVLWYSEGVLNTYLDELAAFYNVAGTGQAPRPDLPVDWRPDPLVAGSLGQDLWQVDVANAGAYSIIYRQGDVWSIFDTRSLGAGLATFTIPSADAVELLVNRNPAMLVPEPASAVVLAGAALLATLRRRRRRRQASCRAAA